MTTVFDLTVAQAARQIEGGALSPVALMESLLVRTKALEPGLNVWVTQDPESALEAARQSEKKRAARTFARDTCGNQGHHIHTRRKDYLLLPNLCRLRARL